MMYRLAGLALLLLAPGGSSAVQYDGAWWNAQTKDSQDHFAAGFLDCSVVFPKVALNGNQYDVSKYISNYYKNRPSEIRMPVSQILLAGGPRPQPPGAPGGEVYTGRHGYFIGEYWTQMDPSIRVSFVLGELVCQQAHHLPVDPARAAQYTTFMNAWFDADHGDSRQANERSGKPIVHALELAIHASVPAKP